MWRLTQPRFVQSQSASDRPGLNRPSNRDWQRFRGAISSEAYGRPESLGGPLEVISVPGGPPEVLAHFRKNLAQLAEVTSTWWPSTMDEVEVPSKVEVHFLLSLSEALSEVPSN